MFNEGVLFEDLGTRKRGVQVLTRVFSLETGAQGNVAYKCLTRVFSLETGAQENGAYRCLTRVFSLETGFKRKRGVRVFNKGVVF